MTDDVYRWVKEKQEKFQLDGYVLDIGSFDANGRPEWSIRDLFTDYIGLDMRTGKNVDVVCSSHNLPYPNEFFDVVVCLEMLEHDSNFYRTIDEAYRVLKSGGYLLLTARANGYPPHNHPNDYWRFTKEGFKVLLERFLEHDVSGKNLGIYGWAQK